ncbi:type II toxin-antitoxin system RelE/ParE family toxin [Methylobacterium sp. JK268]
MHGVLTTPTFEADAADAGLSDEDVLAMAAWLSANPLAGAVMAGTGGARKVRFAGKGKGKSGGYRTIHYYGGDDVPLFLLALIDKGERDNLTKAERNALAAELSCLADDYRSGVKTKLATLKRRL